MLLEGRSRNINARQGSRIALKICICPTTNVLISNNLPVRKSYFNSNILARILRRFFLRIILKWTSTEAHVYMRRHQDAEVKHFHLSYVIYHTVPFPITQWGKC